MLSHQAISLSLVKCITVAKLPNYLNKFSHSALRGDTMLWRTEWEYFFPSRLAIVPIVCQFYWQVIFFFSLAWPQFEFLHFSFPANAFYNHYTLGHINEVCMGKENKAGQILIWFISALLNTFQEPLCCSAQLSAVNTGHNPTLYFCRQIC